MTERFELTNFYEDVEKIIEDINYELGESPLNSGPSTYVDIRDNKDYMQIKMELRLAKFNLEKAKEYLKNAAYLLDKVQ